MRILKLFIVLFFIASCSTSVRKAQHRTDNISSKAQKWYNQAQNTLNFLSPNANEKAISLLKKATTEAPDYFDAYALMGSIYNRMQHYSEAVRCFNKAKKLDSIKLLPAYDLYAHAAAGVGNFSKALKLINKYLQENDSVSKNYDNDLKWKAHYEFGLRSKQKHLPFYPVNMGDSINSKDAEYFPTLTIDAHTMIFTRKINGLNENFLISHKEDSVWSKAHLLKGAFNKGIGGNYNRGAETISKDGKWLFFTICDRADGFGSCDIYYAVYRKTGWSQPRNVGLQINSRFWDSQPSISPDKKDLYFVSNRPGGFGGSDIYVSHLQANGYWSKPENLGAAVNTSGDESSPFIHVDNKTLYFASDGHPGIGGVDLFYVRKKTNGAWGKPHNLGYPINTIEHDGSMFVAADGETAFFASNRKDSRGELDIYKFTLYPEARPIKTLYVHGSVFNKKTGADISASIVLSDLSSGKELKAIQSDRNGHYMVTLPVGEDYAFNVRKKGFLFYSKHFRLKDSVQWQPYEINIALQPLGKNAHIVLENVFFNLDKYHLRPESYAELNQVVQLMEKNPSLEVQINGYTDSTGRASHNLILSQKRAEAVVNYLISKGINSDRLHAKGFGAAHPVAPNNTKQGRAKNRRTELEVLYLSDGS